MQDVATAERVTLGLLRAGDYLFGVEATALAEITLLTKIEPVLSARPEVLGAITLRDVVIPVIDPVALCGLAPRSDPPGIAAVIWNDRNMVALAIDGTVDLLRCDWADLQKVEQGLGDGSLKGQLPVEAGLVNVLDHEALLSVPALPRADRLIQHRRERANRDLIPHLTFQSGDVVYGVEVSKIFNTVPRRKIEDADVASGAFLGTITYLKRRIPVIETNSILNMQAPRSKELPEVVVIQQPEDTLLGLAVDEILRIEYFARASMQPLPDHLRQATPLIKATRVTSDNEQHVLILDADAIAERPDIDEIADMSKADSQEHSPEEPRLSEGAADAHSLVKERTRNLLFLAGSELCAPVVTVKSVIDPPKIVTPWHAPVAGLIGLFTFEDCLVPLIDLKQYLRGIGYQKGPLNRVLVVGEKSQTIGFVVEQIKGIAVSNWRSNPEARLPGGMDMVQVQEWRESRLVSRIALDQLVKEFAQALAENAPA